MASKTHHFKGFSIIDGDVKVHLSLNRFDEQYEKAQYQLDGDVMNSMVPFMPMENGSFVNATRAVSAAVQGSGRVYAAYGQQGRFLYEGKGMVDEKTGSPWARKDAKKLLVSQYSGKTRAKENLTYTKTKHPEAQSHWFDAAKERDGAQWIKDAKETAGGGQRG